MSSGISNLSFERGDGRSLRYADGYFDAVIMHTFLSHVPSPERGLAEAFRVLRPGGWVKPNAERCAGGYIRDKESCGCTYA
jgi:ubiquinone/menaquinone biosynthesis C-methylase UbiE